MRATFNYKAQHSHLLNVGDPGIVLSMPHTLTLVSFTTDVYDKVLLSPFYSRGHLSTLANIKTATDPGFKLINVSA